MTVLRMCRLSKAAACGLTIIPVKRNVMHIKENIRGKAEPRQAVRILFMNIMAVNSDFQNMMIYWRL